jgi:glycosyltransferase involved in cell wall biosynthesis
MIISIIIPVYKTEIFLTRLSKSLINVPEKSEIIIINDASPTFNESQTHELFAGFNHQIIHHEVNRGLFQARLTGMNAATGKYIHHIDSDDWTEPNFHSKMLELAEKYDADMVECDFCFTEDKGNSQIVKYRGFYVHRPNLEIYEEQNHLHRMLRERTAHFQWNRIYKRSLYDDIKNLLPLKKKINVAEDLIFTSALFTKTKRFVRTNQPLYNYHRREGTFTNDDTYESLRNRIWEDWFSYEFLKTLDSDEHNSIKDLIDENQRELVCESLDRIEESGLTDEDKKELREHLVTTFHSKNLIRLASDCLNGKEIDLSIIVTVYDTEMYLSKCLDSIISQDIMKSFNCEIIIVNDGSPNTRQCKEIVNHYQNRNRISIEYIEINDNIGLYSARQVGVDQSIGEYIGFVDSDDWISPHMYSELLMKAYIQNYDVVECGFSIVRNEGIKDHVESGKSIYGHQIGRAVYRLPNSDHILRHEIWSKIYKRELWNRTQNSFPKRAKGKDGGEDLVRVSMLLFNAKSYCYLPKSLYNYNMKRVESSSQNVSLFSVQRYIYGLSSYIQEMENFTKTFNDYDLTTLVLVNNKIWGDVYALFLRLAHLENEQRSAALELFLCEFKDILCFVFGRKVNKSFIQNRYNRIGAIKRTHKELLALLDRQNRSFWDSSIGVDEGIDHVKVITENLVFINEQLSFCGRYTKAIAKRLRLT